MRMMNFADCCTAKILHNLNGREDENINWFGYKRVDVSTYENYRDNWAIPSLVEILKDREKYEAEYRPRVGGYDFGGDLTNLALVFATVNVQQPYALKFLKEVGFRNTKKTKKGAHPERELYGLFADGETLQAWLNDNRDKG